jgi:hypothetical protein
MPNINNIQLSIQKGTAGSRRRVTVNYSVCFSDCEIKSGATFIERVTLRGDDPVFDDHLSTLRSGRCIKADKSCEELSIVRNISRSTLDEDGDTVIFGWVVDANRDELYAQVELTPFEPRKAVGNSNMVYGQFGAGGND